MLVLPVLLAVARCAEARLRLLTASPGTLTAKEGDSAVLECATTTPWFLCVWTGPGGMALHLGEGDRQGEREVGHRVTAMGGHKVCRLEVAGIARAQAGGYRCVLADSQEVETVDREFTFIICTIPNLPLYLGKIVNRTTRFLVQH